MSLEISCYSEKILEKIGNKNLVLCYIIRCTDETLQENLDKYISAKVDMNGMNYDENL